MIHRNLKLTFVVSTLAVLGTAATVWLTREDTRPYQWALRDSIPRPVVPADNPMSARKVELGRHLFYDPRLSVNQSMSCASCHIQALGFTDGRPQAVGATGEVHPRASMSLVNVAYATRLTWANNLLDKLEDQALTPLFSDHPVEMGMAGRDGEINQLLTGDSFYATEFKAVFPRDTDPYSVLNLVRATSAFVRSIVSFESPYDHFLRGDANALSDTQLRGMNLFFSEKLECFHCHGGFNFSDSSTHVDAVVSSVGYHNNGLYNLDGLGAYPADNTGLFDMTGQRRDMGRFRAPSLRNIVATAPYMHDGSLATLEDVIAHYARGGRLVEQGPYAGDGRLSPFKSEFIRGFELSRTEQADLLSFLGALTDPVVLRDERWGPPARPVAR